MPSFIIHVTLWQNPNFCSKNQLLNNPIFGGKIQIQCLKITQNVAFEFWHFPPIFVQLKLTCLVTLFDRKFSKTRQIEHFWAFLMNFCTLKM